MAAKVRKFNTVESRWERWTIQELVDAKIYLDLSFQSIERWDVKHQRDYASSIIQNKKTSNILIVDVKACLKNSTKKSDKNYFRHILEDFKLDFISVDGNNRKVTVNNILDDLVYFHEGSYDDHFIDKDNCYWSTLEDGLKDELLNKKAFRMEILTKATRDDLRDLFLSINNQVDHNWAEKRNAEGSKIAEIVRDETLRHLGKRDKEDPSKILKYNGTLAKIYPEADLKRRFGDKWIAETLLFSASKGRMYDLMSANLLKHYQLDDEGPYAKHWNSALKKVNITLNLIKHQEKKITGFHASYTNLHLLVEWIYTHDFKIKNTKKFYEWWVRTEYNRRKNEDKTYEVSNGTYHTYKGSFKQLSKSYVKVRQQVQIDDFIRDAVELKGIVVSVDPQRLFSPDQRVELWKAQGGKCPETDRKIPITQVMDASKWAADHIERHIDEGETTLENGRLVDKKWHDEHSGDQLRKDLDKAA